MAPPHRSSPSRRAGSLVAGLVLALALVLAAPSAPGAAQTSPHPVPTRTTPFHLYFDTNSVSGRCQYEFGYPGSTDACSGRYSDDGTMPFRDADGTVRWVAQPSGEVELTFFIPNGVITGTIPHAGSADLTVTSGLANWASSMSGALNLRVVDGFTYKFELSGTLTYTPSYHWQPFDLTVATGGDPVPDFNPLCPEYSPTASAYHCLAEAAGPRTPPLDLVSLFEFTYGWDGSAPRADFTVKTTTETGVALRGTVPAGDLATASEFRVDSALHIPWGPEASSGTDPGAAPGEQGGPLHLRFSRFDHGYRLELSGWLLITGIGAPPPVGVGPPEDEPTTIPPTSTTTSTAPRALTAGAVTPRYTG
jgi:hypothetical protein